MLYINPAGDTPRIVALTINQLIRRVDPPQSSVASDTDVTLGTSGANGTFYTNSGALLNVSYTLPPVQNNLEVTFICLSTAGITAIADGLNTIRLGGTISAGGGNAASTVIGSVLTLRGVSASEWIATAIVGTWVVT